MKVLVFIFLILLLKVRWKWCSARNVGGIYFCLQCALAGNVFKYNEGVHIRVCHVMFSKLIVKLPKETRDLA